MIFPSIDLMGGKVVQLVQGKKENKKIEIGDYVADYSKFTNFLGWKPEIGIEEGLKRTFEYYKKYSGYYWE